MSEAHLSADGQLVELNYKYPSEQSKEVCYLKYMEGKPGVPKLYYSNVAPDYYYVPWEGVWKVKKEWKPVAVVERLYEFTERMSDENIYEIFRQSMLILQTWADHSISNSHFHIMHKDNKIYFVDMRRWEINSDMEESHSAAIYKVLEFVSNFSLSQRAKTGVANIEDYVSLKMDGTSLHQFYRDLIRLGSKELLGVELPN
jgi:hypothetical protein